MPVVTTQIINQYYEDYKNTEIIFSRQIINILRMDPRQIYIKYDGLQWPCIVNSTSFTQAKIILGTKSGAYAMLSTKPGITVNLKFCFYQTDGQLMTFFVTGKVSLMEPYMNSSELSIITIQYSQRPPEDLIVMIGNLLDANINATKRKDERILITQDSMRKLGLQKKELIVTIQNIPRHCILQDISFGGAKVILLGLARYLIDKEAMLQIAFEDPNETILIKGVITATDFMEGRKDIVYVSIKFNEESVSMSYKMRINQYITTIRKKDLNITFADDVSEPHADSSTASK